MTTTARSDRRLYYRIAWGMRYWGARLILGWSAVRAGAYANRVSVVNQRSWQRAWRWRQYARLRAQGRSCGEAEARIWGMPADRVRAIHRTTNARYRRKWDGHPHAGSEAWLRRETAKLAKTMEVG